MNELIPLYMKEINDALIQTVNARELHAFLEVGKDFSNWIKDRIEQYNFVENQDFVFSPNLANNPGRGRPSIEYYLSLDMAKELSMVERNEKGKQARLYFIECERQLKVVKLKTPAEMLLEQAKMLVEQERRMAEIQRQQLVMSDSIAQIHSVVGYPGYSTLLGWLNDHRIQRTTADKSSDAKRLVKYCREHGIEVRDVPDERYGSVKAFRTEVIHAFYLGHLSSKARGV